ncbi:MAG: class I SAM-dependent methyltransferase [Pseudomonadota bacterium]
MAYPNLSGKNDSPIKCGVCGAAMPSLLFCATPPDKTSLKQIAVFKCGECGSAQTGAAPDCVVHQKLYFKEYWGSRKTRYQGRLKNMLTDVFLRQRVKNMAACISKTSVILDYGCGNGEFVKAMRRAGYQCYGFEPNARSDCEFISSNISTGAYDLITLWHVFEHFDNPDEELAKIASLLGVEGKLFLSVPNFASIDSSIGGPLWFHLDVPRHMFHYSQRGMAAVLARNGMKVLRCKIPFNWYAFFGVYQTLFNLSGCTTNALYYWLKRGSGARKDKSIGITLKDMLLHMCLAIPYLVVALAVTSVAALFKKSGSLEILCEKE